MKNIINMKKAFLILLILCYGNLFSIHAQEFTNDICLPSKLYLLSETQQNLFVEPFIKRWRPYHDIVRFSGTCPFTYNLPRKATIEHPIHHSIIKVDLINTDIFNVIKNDSCLVYVGKKGEGTGRITLQILGDSYVQGAFYQDAILTKKYIPGIQLIGLRDVKDFKGQYDEGRGGWTLESYFSIPKDPLVPYHGYMQPANNYRYWGSCEFWKNCHKVVNKEWTGFEERYQCGRYETCAKRFNPQTGYLIHPQKNDLMFDNERNCYRIYTGKKWKDIHIDEATWTFNYAKYLEMWNLEAPQYLAEMLGLNDYRDSLNADYSKWNQRLEQMKESYLKAVPNGKFLILIPCSTCGSLENQRGDFTIRQNAAMWRFRKNLIDTFDNREAEGIYLIDIGITIDNENGYNKNKEGLQTGNPHPYPNYPTMGIPLAAFIQYQRMTNK